jgi:very-short-patch-repair endonuclease
MDLFQMHCRAFNLPVPEQEHRFDLSRRWRLDYAFVEQKLGVEIEGGVFTQGRHTRGKGFLGDLEKYNTLTVMGWHLLRFTPAQVKGGLAVRTVTEFFRRRDGREG